MILRWRQILKLLRSLGCGVTLVSGTEMHMALEAGFEPENMLLNGSGKVLWEAEAAVKRGVLLNVDSEFDLQQTIGICDRHSLTLRASLSGTFLQTLPELVTPLKGHFPSLRSCPPKLSAVSERFWY